MYILYQINIYRLQFLCSIGLLLTVGIIILGNISCIYRLPVNAYALLKIYKFVVVLCSLCTQISTASFQFVLINKKSGGTLHLELDYDDTFFAVLELSVWCQIYLAKESLHCKYILTFLILFENSVITF